MNNKLSRKYHFSYLVRRAQGNYLFAVKASQDKASRPRDKEGPFCKSMIANMKHYLAPDGGK